MVISSLFKYNNMQCDICNGTGKAPIIATYNSNWHGKEEQTIDQPCYKCRGSGQINGSKGLQEPSDPQYDWGRSRNLDEGIEK